jgi:hypothetical protein
MFTPHKVTYMNLFNGIFINSGGGGGVPHTGGRGEMHTGFWLGNLRKRSHLKESGVGGRIILKLILKK